MNIGIIGAGDIGANMARLLVEAGHDVALSNSRGAESLASLIAEVGPRARAMSVNDAASFGEVVLLAVPWRSPEALPRAEHVAGKIVIDAMNPYRPDGRLYDLGDSTSSEEVLKRLPGARLVKAFNTIWYKHLKTQSRPEATMDYRRAIPIAGDDADAKRIVTQLIEQIGFAAVDSGSLREGGKRQEPGAAIYGKDLTARQAREILKTNARTP
jgi:predicted dinucleotide-binding enzyme